MRKIVTGLAIICLGANVAPAALFLAGRMDLETMKTAMIWGTVAWFAVGAWLFYGTEPPKLEEPVVP